MKIAELDSETTCPEGKYLNILTGRCKKIEESETTECKTGYYRNPETGRCKKLTTEKTTSDCAEGYERNPETNRCRKIRISSEMSYAPEADAVLPESYENPKVFVGAGILIVLTIVSIVYTILQFRKEIKKFLRRIFRRKAKTQKHGP